MPIDLKKLENAKEFEELHHNLAVLEKNIMNFIADSKNHDLGLVRIKTVNKRLNETMSFSEGDRRCPTGTTFDPNTQTCV
jgi:hypothetical protein